MAASVASSGGRGKPLAEGSGEAAARRAVLRASSTPASLKSLASWSRGQLPKCQMPVSVDSKRWTVSSGGSMVMGVYSSSPHGPGARGVVGLLVGDVLVVAAVFVAVFVAGALRPAVSDWLKTIAQGRMRRA